MGKPYSKELDDFPKTYEWVQAQSVDRLRNFINRWSGDHVAIVGSGGSFSAALVLALFRELAHHSPSTPVSPHEFVSLTRRLAPHVFLLSAEGKNRDIIAAARAAQLADLASVAITLTSSNPLVEFAQEHASLRAFAYQMDWVKDGYLATNSLVATVLLAYRAFFGDTEFSASLGPLFETARLRARRAYFSDWEFDQSRKHGLIVVYTAQAKAFAVDLESKLTEAALGMVQIADVRQFAHGRHLQLAAETGSPAVLLVTSKAESTLAGVTSALLPAHVRHRTIQLEGACEQDVAICGLLDAMFYVEAFAKAIAVDPGQPEVPPFGRSIYAIDSAAVLDVAGKEKNRVELAARRKRPSYKPVNQATRADVVNAASEFADRLLDAKFKAVVCDFDGTLCRAENRFDCMAPEHTEQVSSLIRQGMTFAIATGRGGSLYDDLRKCFDVELHPSIIVGYYSGTLISRLSDPFVQPPMNPAFQELWDWLTKSVDFQHGKSVSQLARGGQLSIRLGSASECAILLNAIRHWLERKKWAGWRVVSSGHSIDILDAATSKRAVVDHVASVFGIDANDEILRLGDSGHEAGNDYELLADGLGLSCDRVSVDLGSCWNFGAPGSNQVDVTSVYLRGLTPHEDAFRLLPSALLGA